MKKKIIIISAFFVIVLILGILIFHFPNISETKQPLIQYVNGLMGTEEHFKNLNESNPWIIYDYFEGTSPPITFLNVTNHSIDVKIDKLRNFNATDWYRIYLVAMYLERVYDVDGNLLRQSMAPVLFGENGGEKMIYMFKSSNQDGTMREYLYFTIDDLQPDTVYRIRVLGNHIYNVRGNYTDSNMYSGIFCKFQEVRTLP